jgi:hypothetical protein
MTRSGAAREGREVAGAMADWTVAAPAGEEIPDGMRTGAVARAAAAVKGCRARAEARKRQTARAWRLSFLIMTRIPPAFARRGGPSALWAEIRSPRPHAA